MRDRAIVRLRNDTVFARFGVAAKIYENVGGEEERVGGEEALVGLRQSRAFG